MSDKVVKSMNEESWTAAHRVAREMNRDIWLQRSS